MRGCSRLLVIASAVILAASVASVPSSAAEPDKWTGWTGPRTFIRSIDYVTPTRIVAGGQDSGVYTATSPDGPWTNITGNLPAAGRKMRQAVGQSGRIYLATAGGLYRGTGTGSPPSWTRLGVAGSVPAANRLDQGGVQSVVFPTGEPTKLVAATAYSARDGVFWSSDSGRTWHRGTGLYGEAYHLIGDEDALWAATSTGIYRSGDNGHSWVLRSDNFPSWDDRHPFRIAISPADPLVLAAAMRDGVFRSDDGGATWHRVASSIPDFPNEEPTGPDDLRFGPVNDVEFLPTAYWSDGVPRLVIGTSEGVWATLDDGVTWGGMAAAGLRPSDDDTWAVTLGSGTTGSLMAGFESALYTLPLQEAEAPATIPKPGGGPWNSPKFVLPGEWAGTHPFTYYYQWYSCTAASGDDPAGSTCTAIPDALSRIYQPTESDVGAYLRVGVRAQTVMQPAPTAEKLSESSNVITAAAEHETTPQPTWPRLEVTENEYGTGGISIERGPDWTVDGVPTDTSPYWYYHWYRCNAAGANCLLIPTGDESSFYRLKPADVGRRIKGTVYTTGSRERVAGISGVVTEKKPFSFDLFEPPRVVGSARVGQVLQSRSGEWSGTRTTFTRRWLRCNGNGVQCHPVSPLVTWPAYKVKPADRGHTFRIEITARQVDGSQTYTTVKRSNRTARVS